MRKKFQNVLVVIAPCHLTKKVQDFCDENKLVLCFIPPRLTNLLQPADVCWFSSIKKLYKEKWNDWFIHGDKTFTKNDNLRSPGYEQSLRWLVEIWELFSSTLIQNSFNYCGITAHCLDENSNILIDIAPLHSVLKQMLESNQVYNDYIDDDFQLQDANNQMNENDDFIFESVETIESCKMVENINEIENEDNLEEMNEEEEMIVQNIENDIENVIPSNQLTTTTISRNLHLDLLKSSKKTPGSLNYRMPLRIIKLASSQAQSSTQSPAQSPAQSSTQPPAQSSD